MQLSRSLPRHDASAPAEIVELIREVVAERGFQQIGDDPWRVRVGPGGEGRTSKGGLGLQLGEGVEHRPDAGVAA